MELFKLDQESKPFTFTCEAKHLLETISRIGVVAAFSGSAEIGKNHFIVVEKGRVYLSGNSSDTFACSLLEANDIKGKGSFCFVPNTIHGTLKGRGLMKFEYTGHSLIYSSVKGKYKGEVPVQNITADLVHQVSALMKVREANTLMVKGELLKHIRTGLLQASIKPSYKDDGSSVIAYINNDKQSLSVTSFDNYHIAHYKAEVKSKSSFRLAVHTSIISVLDKFFEDRNVTLTLSSSGFRAETDDYLVVLPQVQVQDPDVFNMVPLYIEELKKPTATITFDESLFSTLDNLTTLVSADMNKLDLTIKPNAVQIRIKTNNGEAEDVIKLVSSKMKQDKIKLRMDSTVLMDLVRFMRTYKELPFNIYNVGQKDKASCYSVRLPSDNAMLTLIGYYLPE